MMKRTLILLSFILIVIVGKSQDSTYVFVDDTIPARSIIDTIIFSSDFISIDTIIVDREFNNDLLLGNWYVRDSVNINIQKYAMRHIQRGFKKYGTTHVIRFYRYRDVRYIREPERIFKTVILE